MISPEQKIPTPEQSYQNTVWLHLSFIAAFFVYVIILRTSAVGRKPIEEIDLLKYILAGVAVVFFLAILFLRNQMNKPSGLAARLTILQLLTDALAEAIALFGLVLGFMGAAPKEYYPFMAAGLILLLVFWPRRPGL